MNHRKHPPTASHRGDDGRAFLPDNDGGFISAPDDLSAELLEEFVSSATSGEKQAQTLRSAFVEEEIGGPFVTSSQGTEFADDDDDANPSEAEPAAFPTAIGGQR